MKEYEIFFTKLHPEKISFSFTWDDNFSRHSQLIAPAFEQNGLKCTFYVNPGEPNFVARLSTQYAELSLKDFEIGSHGFTHHHYSKLNEQNFIDQLIESKKAIRYITNKTPVTFAFPHHDFTENMLHIAHDIYFETRNTLNNSQRFSLKSNTTVADVINALEDAILNKKSLVFSGHSVSLPEDKDNIDGYEPFSLDCLKCILHKISSYVKFADICTFEQAALKEYIKNHCYYTNEKVELSNEQVFYLNNMGLELNRIKQLI